MQAYACIHTSMMLIFTAPSLHNCHPKRLRNMITTGPPAQRPATGISYKKDGSFNCKLIYYTFSLVLALNMVFALIFRRISLGRAAVAISAVFVKLKTVIGTRKIKLGSVVHQWSLMPVQQHSPAAYYRRSAYLQIDRALQLDWTQKISLSAV